MYQPSALLRFLQEQGCRPQKRNSQNFLIDGNILRKMVSTVLPEDIILEIGPGPGALTELLLTRAKRVIAIEKDPLLAKALYRLVLNQTAPQTSICPLEVHCADALSFPLDPLWDTLRGSKVKILSNLPYHITTPLLARF